MTTTNTKTIKASGGDYTSLNTWEAGRQADLVSLDYIEIAECYAISDTTACSINGWTTGASNYIKITCPVGERHAGAWTTSKYNLQITGDNSTQPLTISESYVRVEYIQLKKSVAGYGNYGMTVDPAASSTYVLLESIIFAGGPGHGIYSSNAGTVEVRNSIIYGFVGGAGIVGAWGANRPTINIYNCTVTKNSTYGIDNTDGAVITAKNNYLGGNTSGALTGTVTETTNNKTTSLFTAKFVDSGDGTEDFHLQSDSPLINTATDLSATFTIDIDNETRVAWDIGADEYISTEDVSSSCGLSSEGISSSCGLSSEGISSSCGLSSEGISSSCGLSSEGISSSCGLSSEGVSSEGLSSEGISSSCGLSSEGISSSCGLSSEGISSSCGLSSEGISSSCGLSSEGVSSQGVSSEGVSSEGISSSSLGLSSEGISSSCGLSSEGFSSEGISSQGLSSQGISSSCGLSSEGISSSSMGFSSQGLSSSSGDWRFKYIPNLYCEVNTENEFDVTYVYTIGTYSQGDWDGSSGSLVKFMSDTADEMAEIVAPYVSGGIHVSYTYWKDIQNTGSPIYADDGTSVDGGGNIGIIFHTQNPSKPQHIPRLECEVGAENNFRVAYAWYIDTYEGGDWDGMEGSLVKFFSEAPGYPAEIVAPEVDGGIHVSFTQWTDINNTGATIYADDGTSIDGGGNTGIAFTYSIPSRHIPGLITSPGADTDFSVDYKWYIDTYTAGDWNGGISDPAVFHSSIEGTAVEIIAPTVVGGIHVSYTEWKDIHNTGATIYANDGTSIDRGGNSGIDFSITLQDQHIPSMDCDPHAEVEFSIAYRWYIDNYTAGDWSGTTGGLTKFYSGMPGSPAEIVAPTVTGGIHVSYSIWTDIHNTGATIYADDGTSIDGGGNTGIQFTPEESSSWGLSSSSSWGFSSSSSWGFSSESSASSSSAGLSSSRGISSSSWGLSSSSSWGFSSSSCGFSSSRGLSSSSWGLSSSSSWGFSSSSCGFSSSRGLSSSSWGLSSSSSGIISSSSEGYSSSCGFSSSSMGLSSSSSWGFSSSSEGYSSSCGFSSSSMGLSSSSSWGFSSSSEGYSSSIGVSSSSLGFSSSGKSSSSVGFSSSEGLSSSSSPPGKSSSSMGFSSSSSVGFSSSSGGYSSSVGLSSSSMGLSSSSSWGFSSSSGGYSSSEGLSSSSLGLSSSSSLGFSSSSLGLSSSEGDSSSSQGFSSSSSLGLSSSSQGNSSSMGVSSSSLGLSSSSSWGLSSSSQGNSSSQGVSSSSIGISSSSSSSAGLSSSSSSADEGNVLYYAYSIIDRTVTLNSYIDKEITLYSYIK